MITALELRNFQAHKDTLFEFDNGVNAIVGESDVGKSAALRALYWVVFGKPTGDSMIRRGVRSPCEVTIKTSDGHTIRRVRGKTDNFYEVDGRVLKAFGKGVPEDVTDALNLSEINFSRQLDPPFGLSMSGTELAQYLNKLIDLEVIGVSLSNINKMANYSSAQTELDKESISQAKNKIRSFKWLADAEKDVAKLEALESKAAKQRQKANRLREELDACRKSEKLVADFSFAKEASKKFDKLTKLADNVAKWQETYDTLDNCLVLLERASSSLLAAKWIKSAEKDVSALSSRMEKLQKLTTTRDVLYTAEQKVAQTAKKLQEATCVHKEAALYYRQHKPETCPLCGHTLKEDI